MRLWPIRRGVERDPGIQAVIDGLVADIMAQGTPRAEAWKVFNRAPHALELEELMSLALSGLAHAAARWQEYCAKEGHDPHAVNYFGAYAMQRMRGAMLDAMRSQDWVTRSARNRAKQLRDAGQDQGKSDQELAEATGMTVAEVRETAALISRKPVSIDAEPHDVADETDVEAQAVVSSVLGSAHDVIRQLPANAQVILVLRYYHGLSLPEAARAVGVREDEASRLHNEAVLKVHNAMVKAVS
jgi:RNA polymerase sigma factor for flagellar operon FliA